MVTIPPELWRQILRFATADPPNEPPLSFDNRSGAHIQPENSKRMKLTLVSVCRQFRQIAYEFLYETLNVTNVRCARRLANSFQHTSSVFNPHSAMSEWTHYIGISINEGEWANVDVIMRDVLYILRFCSNLREMFVYFGYHGGPRESRLEQWRKHRCAILQTIPSALYLLKWRERGSYWAQPPTMVEDSFTRMSLNRQTGSLRILELAAPTIATHLLSFPQLTHLTLHQLILSDLSFLNSWETPALMHLKLICYDDDGFTDIAPFWDNAKLSLLSVDLLEFQALTTPLARKIITMSPHLQQLSYSYSLSCAEMWQNVGHSSLRDVSIALRRFTLDRSLDGGPWGKLRDHLRPLNISVVPSLENLTVDCYDPESVIHGVTDEEPLYDIVATLRSEGVHVSIST